MALNRENALLDIAGAYFHKLYQEQSWAQRHSNTVTTIVGALVTLSAYFGSMPFAEDPRVQAVIAVVGFIGTVVGVSKTKNGISKSIMDKVAAAQVEHVATTPLIPRTENNLDAEVVAYNARTE